MTTKQKIEKLEQELLELKAECGKPKKFEIKWRKNKTYLLNYDYIKEGCDGINIDLLNYGRFRKTKQGAELSLVRNKRANRLEMLVEYLGGLKEFEYGSENYFIFKDSTNYNFSYTTFNHSPEKVYMTKEVAQQVCNILNNGEYTL